MRRQRVVLSDERKAEIAEICGNPAQGRTADELMALLVPEAQEQARALGIAGEANLLATAVDHCYTPESQVKCVIEYAKWHNDRLAAEARNEAVAAHAKALHDAEQARWATVPALLAERASVTIDDILKHTQFDEPWRRAEARKIAAGILFKAGWRLVQRRRKGDSGWVYEPPARIVDLLFEWHESLGDQWLTAREVAEVVAGLRDDLKFNGVRIVVFESELTKFVGGPPRDNVMALACRLAELLGKTFGYWGGEFRLEFEQKPGRAGRWRVVEVPV